MAARFEPEEDETDHEMSSLQSGPKPYEGSEGRLHEDEEEQNPEAKRRNQDAAYRKLYGIVTIMTMFLFGLNIVQVCLLPVISSLYWIVLFPGIIFLAFTAWAAFFITSNRPLFTGHLGSPGQGWLRAFQHLAALFKLQGRSARASERRYLEPSWPRRFERAGIFLTIYLNIILTQFIYMPIFAVPAFQEIIWKMELNSSRIIPTPSFALLQNPELARRAKLEDDAESIEQMCRLKEDDPVFQNMFCFENWGMFDYGREDENHTAAYVTFDASQFPNISQSVNLGLWYQYSYNSSASRDPLLSLAAFDAKFVEDFPRAFNCGIIASTSFPAGERVQATLRPVTINDPYDAMRRERGCRNQNMFEQYNMYEVDVTPLGSVSAPGSNNCDLADDNYDGSCNAGITIQFPSTLTRVYTSEHGKDWITILTEEGGVVGFVTFLTWFFGIFKV